MECPYGARDGNFRTSSGYLCALWPLLIIREGIKMLKPISKISAEFFFGWPITDFLARSFILLANHVVHTHLEKCKSNLMVKIFLRTKLLSRKASGNTQYNKSRL